MVLAWQTDTAGRAQSGDPVERGRDGRGAVRRSWRFVSPPEIKIS